MSHTNLRILLRRGCFAAIAAASLAGSAQAATQIVNGSFESASINPGSGFIVQGAGSTAITGWTVGGHSIDYIGGYWQAKDGARSIDLSGNDAGSVFQTIGTSIGELVTVSFWLAGNPDGGDTMKLTITSATGAPAQQDTFTVVPGTNTRTDMGWQQFFYSFTATTTSTTLTFASGEPGFFGPALDLVSIVPEPGTWTLMIAGFGAIGLSMRRRTVRAALPA